MLEGREEHNALIFGAVVLCVLGAVALTTSLFISYCCEHCHRMSCVLGYSGGISVLIGMGVGKYTKWHSQR